MGDLGEPPGQSSASAPGSPRAPCQLREPVPESPAEEAERPCLRRLAEPGDADEVEEQPPDLVPQDGRRKLAGGYRERAPEVLVDGGADLVLEPGLAPGQDADQRPQGLREARRPASAPGEGPAPAREPQLPGEKKGDRILEPRRAVAEPQLPQCPPLEAPEAAARPAPGPEPELGEVLRGGALRGSEKLADRRRGPDTERRGDRLEP